MSPELAYVMHALPGDSLQVRLGHAARLGLSAEVANRTRGAVFDPRPYRDARVPIVSVQAYAMHDFHPLHADPTHRARAADHVRDSLELAARIGARYVVTVCGFGPAAVDEPFERSLEFFAGQLPAARDLGVIVLIEPLSPLRAGAMNDPHEVAALVETLDAPEQIGLLLDTGHLLDSGLELDGFLGAWTRPVEALQLKGPASSPPTPGLLGPWFERLCPTLGVVSVEHRQPIDPADLERLAGSLRGALAHLSAPMS